jgi:hypothetical protein
VSNKQDWISAAFKLLEQPLDEHDVVEQLIAAGCPNKTAYKLVAFIPTACGRVALARAGIALSDKYRGVRADGSVGEPERLAADPEWNAAAAFVSSQNASNPDAVHRVGTGSAEFRAANKAMLDGSRAADLVCADPVFHFVEPADSAPPAKRRWVFWRR